ncbi:MAG: serine/threonine-protein kinase, partial [Myxococcota bacterium]
MNDSKEAVEQFDDTTAPTAPSRFSVSTPSHETGLIDVGERAGQYVIRRMVDRGGCGIVYEGEHSETGQSAAIKVLRSEFLRSPEMLERFAREARAIDAIRHPNIVRVYEVGTLVDGRPFLIMELLRGTSLRTLRKQRGAFSPDEVSEVLASVCAALEAVHEAGYVHRDLKSSNIMVSDDRTRVTLLDFGIAKLMRPHPSQTMLTSIGH